MKKEDIFSKILDCSVSGFYKWKKQNRLIIKLLEKYFTQKDLEEFIDTGSITKLEALEGLSIEDVKFILDNKEIIMKFQEIKQLMQGSPQ
ncbi:MAG: hypothetical protein PHE73_08590 [Sulfurovaceae bacterium]|nr:hypothetical protein [Sulfurovaceae bacterium]